MNKVVYYGASNQELVVSYEIEDNIDAHLEINNRGKIHCPITGDEYNIWKIHNKDYAIRLDYVNLIKQRLGGL